MKKLIVVTNPNCEACKDMRKKNICDGIEKEVVLFPLSPTDIYLFDLIWSTEDWVKTFEEMLDEKPLTQPINQEVNAEVNRRNNFKRVQKIKEKVSIHGTPMFLTEDTKTGEIELIAPPAPDFKSVLKNAINN